MFINPSAKVDPVLTGFATDFRAPGLIGDELFPTVPVDSESGYYYDFSGSKDHLRVEDDTREQYSEAKIVTRTHAVKSYGPLIERSLMELVPEKILKQFANVYDPLRRAAEAVTYQVELGREKRLATLLTTAANFSNDTTLSGTAQFNDYTNSDPIGVFESQIDKIEVAVGATNGNLVAAMSKSVFLTLRRHPDVLAIIYGSNNAQRPVSEQQLAEALGVDRVVVGGAMENTAKEGQTPSLSRLWGKHVILGIVDPNPSTESNTGGYRLRGNLTLGVESWWDNDIKCQKVRYTDYFEDKLVNETAFAPIYNATA
jgi:hypothetical protein